MKTLNFTFFIPYIAFLFMLICSLMQFVKLVRLGKPNDKSEPSGSVTKSLIYANTVAMMPKNKESAYKHWFIYLSGIVYHIGSFLALAYFLFFFALGTIPCLAEWVTHWKPILLNQVYAASALALLATGTVGAILLIHRFFSKKLKPITHFDDYFSNSLTTLFHLASSFYLLTTAALPTNAMHNYAYILYIVVATLFFLYFPFGKLRHAIYYFAARYHLGFFYGWRNSWPPKK